MKNKLLIFIAFIIVSNLIAATATIKSNKETWEPKPMIEGNRRVDELIEWHKDHPNEIPPLTEEEKYEYFIKDGYPLPGEGAKVVDTTRKNFNPQQRTFVDNYKKSQKTKGYYEQYSKRAVGLLSMPERIEQDLEKHKALRLDSYDTHIREVLYDLPMNYAYKGIPNDVTTKIIGYAPEHTYVNTGWNGAVAFFIPTFKAVCAYHEININLTKTSAFIPKDVATYKVNSKLTKINVEGNQESGFIYDVEWWDKIYKRNLECATNDFDANNLDKIINVAKQIDKF